MKLDNVNQELVEIHFLTTMKQIVDLIYKLVHIMEVFVLINKPLVMDIQIKII